VQVPDSKEVANHVVPESCASHREVRREALTGVRIGQPLSHDRPLILGADVVTMTEGNMVECAIASTRSARRGRRTWHVRTLLARDREISGLTSCLMGWPASGRRGAVADDERTREVRLRPVAMKPANKAGPPAAEWVEPRAGTKGNTGQPHTRRTQSRGSVSQGLDRVRNAARQRKKEKFTALLHHVTIDLLRESFLALKRRAAPGVDGVTWQDYEAHLEGNLQELHAQVHRGSYRALPVRRRFIPKPDGKQRPLGIAALEDKIVQSAVVTVLNAIYEEDFLGFSYGFRPGRSQHDAMDALAVAISDTPVNWILDADIRGFFGAISKEWMIKFLEHRIGDERVIRLARKWLKAGVLEDGKWSVSETGTPQGAVVSPLLANVYLHYVFDLWAQQWRRREATGHVIVVRYADDIVVGFERDADARRFWDAMRERFEQFSLELHGEKTRLLEFGRLAAARRERAGLGKPETFTFPGVHVHMR
jgi:RNA-directed DNA polymerase